MSVITLWRCFTLKADVFPVCPIARTVQPAANQPLINRLKDTHMDGLVIVHMTYRKHTHKKCKTENQGFIRIIHEFHTWWHYYINRPCKHTLTLCDGEDQIPLLQQFPVQPWRTEEEVCDGSQTCPANGGLDVLLQVGVGTRSYPLNSYLNIHIKTRFLFSSVYLGWDEPLFVTSNVSLCYYWRVQHYSDISFYFRMLVCDIRYQQVPKVCGLKELQGFIEGDDRGRVQVFCESWWL